MKSFSKSVVIALLAVGFVGTAFPRSVSAIEELRGCQMEFARAGVCAMIQWQVGPSTDQPNSFLLQFVNGGSGQPVEMNGILPFVTLFMPAMGHGSSPVTLSRPIDANGNVHPGLYQVSKAHFMMAGDWQIKIQLRQGSNVVDQALLNLHL